MNDLVLRLSRVFCVHRSGAGDAAALQGLDLELARGEVLAVLGPSGAGKSTLLRVIAGLQQPSAGVVALLGRDIGRLDAAQRASIRRREIGFVDQRVEGGTSDAIAIRDVVALPLALRGARTRERRLRADELLSAVGLGDRARDRVTVLSGGERQRVALCAALVHRPALLLADEPSGELDAAGARMIRELITQLSRAAGSSAVIASHDPEMAAAADRVVVVRDGRVVESWRGPERVAVVGQGGWLPISASLLAQARIGDVARVTPVQGGLLVEPGGGTEVPMQRARRPSLSLSPSPGLEASAEADTAVPAPASVQARAVSCSRGRGRSRRLVLDALDIELAPGRLTAVTGRSGSGKTTLLRMLSGLELPDRGEVVIDGRSLSDCDAEERAALRRGRLAYLSQNPAPVGFLSATENLAVALQLRGVPRGEAVAQAGRALELVGLGERARQPAARLSAGEAQRLGLARAVACAGGLLILDEPTSKLDRLAAAAVAGLLAAAAAGGQTVICATHDPEVIALAAQIVALDR
ncbi:MAG: ATP-binding cassette domain-containing protein [Solirubrobacteraceae bacterium]